MVQVLREATEVSLLRLRLQHGAVLFFRKTAGRASKSTFMAGRQRRLRDSERFVSSAQSTDSVTLGRHRRSERNHFPSLRTL